MDFSVNADGVATSNDFTADLSNMTESAITVSSFFIQDQISLTDNLKLMLGVRADSFDITVYDIDDDLSTSRLDDELSPRAGLILKPQENISLYYSYSESFLPRSGEQFKKLSESNSRLDPDVFENNEFGLKWSLSPNLSLTASMFSSEQVQAVRDSDTGETSEIVGLQVDGTEIELKGQVSDNLSLIAGFTSLDGETSSGGEPREVPDHMLSLFALYEVNEKFGVGFGFTQQGESNIGNNNPDRVLPEYTRIDASAYYNFSDDLNIRLNIENFGDEVYFPHSHSSHQATVGEPFNARVSITRRF